MKTYDVYYEGKHVGTVDAENEFGARNEAAEKIEGCNGNKLEVKEAEEKQEQEHD